MQTVGYSTVEFDFEPISTDNVRSGFEFSMQLEQTDATLFKLMLPYLN